MVHLDSLCRVANYFVEYLHIVQVKVINQNFKELVLVGYLDFHDLGLIVLKCNGVGVLAGIGIRALR